MSKEIIIAILTGGIGSALVSGVFPLIKWLLERRAHKEDRELEKADKGESIRTDIAAIKKTLDNLEEAVGGLTIAGQCTLFDRIEHLAKKHIEQGWISAEDLEKLIGMHRVYHDVLHGNGYLDTLMEKVKDLPVHDKEG